jgi:hypothetical protein
MLSFTPCQQFVASYVREVSRVIRWTVASAILVVGCWAGGMGLVRAETLGEALSAAFSPSPKPHAAAAKTQKPAEKPAARADENAVKGRVHIKRPPDSKPVAHEAKPAAPPPRETTSPPPVALTTTVATPPPEVAAPPPQPAAPPAREIGPLTPRSVQTLTLLPPAASPAPAAAAPSARAIEAAAPDTAVSREQAAPQLAAVTEQEVGASPASEPTVPVTPTPTPTPANGLVLLQLLLLTAICGLVSLNSESRAPLVWLERSRRGGFRDALARLGAYLRIIGRSRLGWAFAEASLAPAPPDESDQAFTPHWTVVWKSGDAPLAAGAVLVPPGEAASAAEPGAEVVHLDRACPEFEDQLALLVQDQIVVPLRKAS